MTGAAPDPGGARFLDDLESSVANAVREQRVLDASEGELQAMGPSNNPRR